MSDTSYLDAPTVTVLEVVEGIGWTAAGQLLAPQQSPPPPPNLQQTLHNPSNDIYTFVSQHILELAQVNFNPTDHHAVKVLDFEVCSDGIRHSTQYHRRPDFSIMGMNIRFQLKFSSTITLIMACTDRDWNPPMEMKKTYSSPTMITKFFKKTLHCPQQQDISAQVIKIINAFSGQQFALYIVGNKTGFLTVDHIKVESYPIPMEVSTQAYNGQLMVIYEKLFDLERFLEQQALNIIKYYMKVATRMEETFGKKEAKAFLKHCQSKFCLKCRNKAKESDKVMVSATQSTTTNNENIELTNNNSQIESEASAKGKLDHNSDVQEEAQTAEMHTTLVPFNAHPTLPGIIYCMNNDCMKRIIHKGDYRMILDEKFVKTLIFNGNHNLEMKKEYLHRRRRSKKYDSSDEFPIFNLNKWRYRDKVIEKHKTDAELRVEEQVYKDMGDVYKRICPKCKMIEPFLDARFHRLLLIAEEEKERECKQAGKVYVKSTYKAKCIKCRVPYVPRITWDANTWEQKTNNFVVGKIYRRETLANLVTTQMRSDKWKKKAFTSSPNPRAKISLLHKELTDEGFRRIFKAKKKKKSSNKKTVKIIPEPIEIPDISQTRSSKEVNTPNSKVSVTSGFFVTSTGEMVFFDDENIDEDETLVAQSQTTIVREDGNEEDEVRMVEDEMRDEIEDEVEDNELSMVVEEQDDDDVALQDCLEDYHIQSKLSGYSESVAESEGSKTMSVVLEKLKSAMVLDQQLSTLPEEVLKKKKSIRPKSAKFSSEVPRQQPIPVFVPPF